MALADGRDPRGLVLDLGGRRPVRVRGTFDRTRGQDPGREDGPDDDPDPALRDRRELGVEDLLVEERVRQGDEEEVEVRAFEPARQHHLLVDPGADGLDQTGPAQLDGVITEVHFKEGQDVKRGNLLFVIDPRARSKPPCSRPRPTSPATAKAAQSKADESRYSYLLKQRVARSNNTIRHTRPPRPTRRRSPPTRRKFKPRSSILPTPRFARQSTAAPATCWCIRGIWSRTTRTPRWS